MSLTGIEGYVCAAFIFARLDHDNRGDRASPSWCTRACSWKDDQREAARLQEEEPSCSRFS